jgi:hypothetical protein
MPVVRQVVRTAAQQDYRFSAIVAAIIRTNLFQSNTVPVPEIGTAPAVANNSVQ